MNFVQRWLLGFMFLAYLPGIACADPEMNVPMPPSEDLSAHAIPVVVSIYCYRINPARGPEVLLLQRSSNARFFPGNWECCTAFVSSNESFLTAAQKHLKNFTNLTATRWKSLECFEIELPNHQIVPGISFSCKTPFDVRVSVDNQQYCDYRWFNITDLDDMIFINLHIKQAIIKLLMIHGKLL